MFTLAKWYLDLVTDDGTAIIGYSARLAAGALRVGYSSVLQSVAGVPANEMTALGQAEPPFGEDELVTWHQPKLTVRGRWQRLAPPIDQRLVTTSDGELRWNCVMPRSLAQIDLAGSRYIGIGYVERLTLTLPPWRLPFTFLLWGRHASASCSVIWIAWRGEDERCFIWHNGRPQSDAVLRERSIQGLTGGAELRIGEPRDVCARPALEQLVNRLPDAARSLAQPVAAMFEHKMVAPSRVIAVDGETDIGWTVFEEVRW